MKISARSFFYLLLGLIVFVLTCLPVIGGPQPCFFSGAYALLPTARAANIIALPNRSMPWEQAVVFCSGEGGRLPAAADVTAKWVDGSYWLSDKAAGRQAGIAIVNKDSVTIGAAARDSAHQVVCVQP